MQEAVELVTERDVLRDLHNSYLQKRVTSEVHIRFYNWKQKNLHNGDSIRNVKQALLDAQRNFDNNSQMLTFIESILTEKEGKHEKTDKDN